jgi:signal transduction histidine kinase
VTTEILNDHGQDLLHTYVPVLVAGQPAGALELSESLEERDRYVRNTIHRILVNTLIVFVLTGTAFAALGGWFVGRPVNSLIRRANAIAQGDLEHRLQLRQKDELGQLARALNTMCDQLAATRDQLAKETAARIASLDQLRHADRLATVGQFASEVAHEFGTPLNVMMARAKMIRTSPAVDAETQNNAHIVAEQAERMTKIIHQLLDFARPKAPHRIRVDLCEILKRAADLLTSVAQGSGVVLRVDSCSTPHWTDADPEQLQQVVANLVVNAVQATPPGGEVKIGCRLEEVSPSADIQRPAGRYCCIYVADQGQGISAEDLPRVFEPFFTTKKPGEGTGLGLSVSQGIITEHRGWIQVESEIGKGSRFTVYIPEGSANEEPRSGG